jgi:ABC transporter substrate binding protein
MPDTFLGFHRAEITSLAARYGLPAVYPFRYFTEIGGLLSYGNDPLDLVRRAAIYTDRILKGEKPSELPVQAPVKFELVIINLKTAKALGLDVPPTSPAARRRGDRITGQCRLVAVRPEGANHLHYGKGRVSVYEHTVFLESDFEVGPGPACTTPSLCFCPTVRS